MDQWEKWQQQYGAPADAWGRPARPQRPARRRRGKHGFGLLLLIVAGLVALKAGVTPWAFHMGGIFTPGMSWDGYGAVEASNGGRYLLFTHLNGGFLGGGQDARHTRCSTSGVCDDLAGAAILCSRGSTETFDLKGTLKAFLRTDGAATRIRLTGGSPNRLPSGWVVAFHGQWQGPDLALESPDNSFTTVFTPGGAIRRVTSTEDAGTARVTLHHGSQQEFLLACSALQAGEGPRHITRR